MSTRRGPWSSEEDLRLLSLIDDHGPTNWVRISQILGSRTPKQCRERYHQNLKPSLNHSPISEEEGIYIEQLVAQYGKTGPRLRAISTADPTTPSRTGGMEEPTGDGEPP